MILMTLLACEPPPPERPGVLTVVQEQTAAWIRNFNPLITTGGSRWPSRNGVYEPLFIHNGLTSEWTPWLGTSFIHLDEVTVQVSLRPGVRWSDGEAFDANDVRATFDVLLSNGALDTAGFSTFLDRVDVIDPLTVQFVMQRPFAPGFGDLAHQPIVAEHILSGIEDPLTWANPDPVATGPFTEVRTFRPQVFELGRNPHYWGGEPEVEAMRFPALGSNDQVALALIQSEIDWAGAFVPAVERLYVARDPEHHRYWFPAIGTTVMLYANTTRPPFDDPDVRRALSMAIDRQLVVDVAMYAYTHPADGTGLSDAFDAWRDPAAAASADWVRHDPARAARLLDAAGCAMGEDGIRRTPDGTPFTVELMAVSGWSDWIRASQVIARDLQKLGIDARLRSYDFGAWFERLGRGDFDLSMSWSEAGATPWRFYRALASNDTRRPVGEASQSNWHRFGSTRMDVLLREFERVSDRTEQGRLVNAMQQVFVDEVPAIPLFPNPDWGEYNTRRFTGWPSADNPFAQLSPNAVPSPLLVMTALERVDRAQARK